MREAIEIPKARVAIEVERKKLWDLRCWVRRVSR